MRGACSMHEEKGIAYRNFVGKPEGNIPLRKLTSR
jgi:hypothetical protein